MSATVRSHLPKLKKINTRERAPLPVTRVCVCASSFKKKSVGATFLRVRGAGAFSLALFCKNGSRSGDARKQSRKKNIYKSMPLIYELCDLCSWAVE